MITFSSILYLLTLILSIGYFLVFTFIVKRKRSRGLHKYRINQAARVIQKLQSFEDDYKISQSLFYLRKINPYTFEELLLTSFQAHYIIKRNKAYSGDGDTDGTIRDQFDNFYFIQAKRYGGTIKKKHLPEFLSVLSNSHATGGLFIHTGKTTHACLLEFKHSKVQTLSGTALINFILSTAKTSVS